MYDLLKKLFPKDYVKAQKVYEPSSVEVGFKVIQLIKLNNIVIYTFYLYAIVMFFWSLGYFFHYLPIIPWSIFIPFVVLIFVVRTLGKKARIEQYLNPTINEKKFFKSNPKQEQLMKKILGIKA